MLQKMEIDGYKLFDAFALELQKGINLICGPNGSGKSAVMEIIYALSRFLAMPDFSDCSAWALEEAFPFRSFCRWRSREKGFADMRMNLALKADDANVKESKTFAYSLTVRYNFLEKKSRVQAETLAFNEHELLSFEEGTLEMLTDDGRTLIFKSDWGVSGVVAGSRNNSVVREFGKEISRMFPLHLIPSAMSGDFEGPAQTLDISGKNFPDWRFFFSNEQSEKQNWVLEQCKNFIPGLVGINNLKKGACYALSVRVKYGDRSCDLAFDELSDGQKALLALYSILANIPDGSVLLIDEPENFLARSELQPWLNAIYDAREERDIQFLIISHNPEIVNRYHREAIIFSLEGEPPRVAARRHADESSEETLLEKLEVMEWSRD